MNETLRQQIIEEQYVAYQKGTRSWLGLIPLILFGFAFPFVAATDWGARHLGFSPLIYVVSIGIFVLGVVVATWGHHTYGSLSKRAQLLDTLETFGSAQTCILLVLGPGTVLHVGWVFMAIFGLIAIPVTPKTRAPLTIYLASLVVVILVFWVRDGWINALGAGVIALASVIPMHPLLGYQRQSLDTEISRRELLKELADAQVELERQRISRGLHDGLSGQLTATLWFVRSAKSKMPAEVAENLDHNLQRCLVELRSAVWNVDDAPVELGAVASRISRIPELLMDERVIVQCDVADPHQTIDARKASLLLASSLELTFNALREKTSGVHIWLQDESTLIIQDDGPGLPSSLPEGGGIRSLQTRLENIGGKLGIDSKSGKTTMTVIV
jgi:signal transduction histidine kinase